MTNFSDEENNINQGYFNEFKCYICGDTADFIVHLELIKDQTNYSLLESLNQIPFYLCSNHEFVYNQMKSNVELKLYFVETLKTYK